MVSKVVRILRVTRPERGECRISSEMWQEKNRFFSRTKFFDLRQENAEDYQIRSRRRPSGLRPNPNGSSIVAALLAANIAVPAGIWFAGITALPLAFIGAGVLFLPLFIFLPKLIRQAMKVDTEAASKNPFGFFSFSNCALHSSSNLEAFGRNGQTRKVFWALFAATVGLVLAEVVDPGTAEQIVEMLAGIIP